MYVADENGQRIRKVFPNATVVTFSGGGNTGDRAGGYLDGIGTDARFNNPVGVALGVDGFVYVTDQFNNRVRKISPLGEVSTLAGSGTFAYVDGTGTGASFMFPGCIAVDANNNVYVNEGRRIRKIDPAGVVSTITSFTDGDDGCVSTDAYRNVFFVHAVDSSTPHSLFQIFPNGSISVARTFPFVPTFVTFDSLGNIFTIVYNNGNYAFSVVLAANDSPNSLCCSTVGAGYIDGPASVAQFGTPGGAVVYNGSLFVVDNTNNVIRRISA
jgi:hypothetical protein